MEDRLSDVFVRKAISYGSEILPLTVEDLYRRGRNQGGMICWICNISIHGRQSRTALRENLGIRGIKCSMQERRLHWFEHVMHMSCLNVVCRSAYYLKWMVPLNEGDPGRHRRKWRRLILECWSS